MKNKTLWLAALDLVLVCLALYEIKGCNKKLEEIKDSYNWTGKKLTY